MLRDIRLPAVLTLLILLVSSCTVTVRPGLSTLGVATSKEACKDGGWQRLTTVDGRAFRNQGDCVSYVESGR